jgi:predicted nucleotidyltransferase
MGLLDRIRETVNSFSAVRLAAVFGSAARGDEGPGSDLDLGLLLAPDTPELRLQIEAAVGGAAARDVDLIYLDAAPALLRFEIARDGVLLRERHPHGWADFRARAMIDWWDWAPTARMINDAAIRRLRERVDPTRGAP